MPPPTAAASFVKMLTTATTSAAAVNQGDQVLQLGRTVGRLAESLATTTLATPLDSLADRQSLEALTTTAATLPLQELFPTSPDGFAADQMILNEQQAQIRASSLYSMEEFIPWTSTESCTALVHALLASFSVILVSELGDKTFIITAIMAMKNSRLLVFVSSALALFLMTVLSVGMGVAVTVIPKLYTHYASIVLFLCFGLKMLKEAYDMKLLDEGDESEFDEVKRSLEAADKSAAVAAAAVATTTPMVPPKDGVLLAERRLATINETSEPPLTPPPMGEKFASEKQQISGASLSQRLAETLSIAPVVIKVFTMVFIAEWGDRSQISTVILAAREDVAGVFVGSLSGHVLCTGLAVIGGRFVADMISVRTMTLLGGIVFLFFAAFAIITGPEAPA